MRRHVGAALVLALLTAACGGPAPDRVAVAAGSAGEEIPVPAPTSTTVAPAPTTTTNPVVTSTTIRAATRTPTTGTRTPTTGPLPTATPAAVAPRTRGPYPPGVSGTTLSATTTSGDTTLALSFFPADQYFGEIVQVRLELSTREAVRSVKVDFGNGTVVDATPPGFNCPGKVRPLYPGAPIYTYPAPGRYVVKAVVTSVPCVPSGATPPPGFPTEVPDPFSAGNTVEVTATYDQAPDRPPPPVGPPPGR